MRHLISIIAASLFILAAPMAIAGGDAAKGKTAATEKGCSGCHGADGNSALPQWPKIAGQGEKYLVKQLNAFRTNNLAKAGRVDPTMAGPAKGLTDAQIQDISAYFASQESKVGEADPKLVELGKKIYRGGDKERGLPSCMGCHGPTGAGNPAIGYPQLSGQWAQYTAKQLNDFKLEKRRNDGESRVMRDITSRMYAEEIKAVASYIQGLHD